MLYSRSMRVPRDDATIDAIVGDVEPHACPGPLHAPASSRGVTAAPAGASCSRRLFEDDRVVMSRTRDVEQAKRSAPPESADIEPSHR
jgi:zona occludens toxin (predicted ATPase)